MYKTILAVLIGALLVGGAYYAATPQEENVINVGENGQEEEPAVNEEMAKLIDCLAEKGVVIYGSEWCPACAQLVDAFGGYDTVAPLYVECTEEEERCGEEKKTGYVPEIQIEGELYTGRRTPSALAVKVECSL